MNPKEKAEDLVCNFYAIPSTNDYNYGINWEMAKQCALIAVDEVLSIRYLLKEETYFYKKVKQEINNL